MDVVRHRDGAGWGRAGSADGAGELLSGALSGLVRDFRGLAEGQLQAAQSIAQRAGVVVADHGGGAGDESGECGDELAGLVEVFEVGAGALGGVLGQAALDGGGGHEVDGAGGDDLDGGHLGDVAGDFGHRLGGNGIFRTHAISLTYESIHRSLQGFDVRRVMKRSTLVSGAKRSLTPTLIAKSDRVQRSAPTDAYPNGNQIEVYH